MLLKDYGVTLLNFYYEFPQQLKDQEQSFLTQAVMSYKAKDVFYTIDNLIDSTRSRCRQIEFFKKIDLVFSRMTSEEIELLSRRYKQRKTEYRSDNARRKFYRDAEKALKHFKVLLGYIGIDEVKFISLLKSEPFLKSIHQRMPQKKQKVCKKFMRYDENIKMVA